MYTENHWDVADTETLFFPLMCLKRREMPCLQRQIRHLWPMASKEFAVHLQEKYFPF